MDGKNQLRRMLLYVHPRRNDDLKISLPFKALLLLCS